MKIIILQSMAIIAMILISCSDKENSVYLKNGSYSECATGKNLTKAQEEEETVHVEINSINDKSLKVDIFHVLLSCGLEEINSNISFNNGVITIRFTTTGGEDTNCLCSRQLTFEVGNLQEGQSYDCVILHGDTEYASFKFDFTKDLKQTINTLRYSQGASQSN